MDTTIEATAEMYITTNKNAKLSTANALKFMLAGHAIFTLLSLKSGVRFTYKICKADNADVWFVKLLNGPNNTDDYIYIGVIKGDNNNGIHFRHTAKSKVLPTTSSFIAFDWTFKVLLAGYEPKGVEIWHQGQCGRCGRPLTVPESIESGIGPVCAEKM